MRGAHPSRSHDFVSLSNGLHLWAMLPGADGNAQRRHVSPGDIQGGFAAWRPPQVTRNDDRARDHPGDRP